LARRISRGPARTAKALCRTRTGDPFLTIEQQVSDEVTPGHQNVVRIGCHGIRLDPVGQPKRPQDAPSKIRDWAAWQLTHLAVRLGSVRFRQQVAPGLKIGVFAEAAGIELAADKWPSWMETDS
jgi:hypothetical protein